MIRQIGEVPAWRVSGAGNDFLALAEPAAEPAAETVRAWCRRGLAVGADGLFVLRRADAAVTDPGVALAQRPPRVRMAHYNADGGRAELCVNGTRCAARLAFHLGWARGEVVLETDSGQVPAHDAGPDRVAVEIPVSAEPRALTLEVDGADGARTAHAGHRVTVGVPHFVLGWNGPLSEAPVAELGAALRAHPELGAAGANVDFVRWQGPHRCDLRTFERGVEAETLACGSGVLATVATGVALGLLEPPVTVTTRGGFPLEVTAGDGDGAPWRLTGDARLVARLEILPGASARPGGDGA